MKKLTTLIAAAALTSAFGASAFANSPDVYVVEFRNDSDPASQVLEGQLPTAIAIAGVQAESVVIDTTTAAKWEKGAHEAFDRDIVPVFNQWVGLPGFAAVVDAKSKRVIGCVNSKFDASEMAQEIRKMTARASGKAYMSNASTHVKSTQCPPAYNVDLGN